MSDEDARYLSAMERFLDSMVYGQTFNILAKVPEKNLKKYVEAACIYMSRQTIDEVEFSDDYTHIIKKNKHDEKENKKDLSRSLYRWQPAQKND